MCFSAEASFVASAGLGVAGVVALKTVKQPGQIMLALIPLIFCVQQFSEGVLWLSFSEPGFLPFRQAATYGFLFLALVVWPVWIPFSVWFSEGEEKRKKIVFYLLVTGLVVAGLMVLLLVFFPVHAEAAQHHIHYKFDIDKSLTRRISFIYFIPAIIPPFLAGNRKLSVLGLGLLISYVYAAANYPMFFMSVFCYFAAVISVVVVWILATAPRPGLAAPKVT